MDNELNDRIPWEYDNLVRKEVIAEQRKMPEYELGLLEECNYIVIDNVLYTLQSPSNQPEYPRLVLPVKYRKDVINRAHRDVGHASVRKTLMRLQEAYKWQYQMKDVITTLKQCPQCVVHRKYVEKIHPEQLPIPTQPFEYVSMDLSGPYPLSPEGFKYILSIMDWMTGW